MSTPPVSVTNPEFHAAAHKMYEALATTVSRFRGTGVSAYVGFKSYPTSDFASVEVRIYPDEVPRKVPPTKPILKLVVNQDGIDK